MKISELIAKLGEYDPDMEVVILDGFNGGGQPRTINLGPCEWDAETLEEMAEMDCEPDYSDIDSKPGTPIVIMGYGCY
jgi:hypothetical protein